MIRKATQAARIYFLYVDGQILPEVFSKEAAEAFREASPSRVLVIPYDLELPVGTFDEIIGEPVLIPPPASRMLVEDDSTTVFGCG